MNVADIIEDVPEGAVVAVLGAPGSGKSRALQAAAAAGAFRRRVVFDPYARRDRIEASRGKKCSPWPGRLVAPEDVIGRPAALDLDPLALVVGPHELAPRALGEDFASLARLAWSTGDLDVIGEEAGLYSRHAIDLMMQLASGGRHAGLRLFLVSQSMTRITIDARRHFSHAIVFAQGEDSDITALRKRCGRAFAERVQSLKLGDLPLVWRLGAATLEAAP